MTSTEFGLAFPIRIDREGLLAEDEVSAIFQLDDELRCAGLELIRGPGLHGVADSLSFRDLLDTLGRREQDALAVAFSFKGWAHVVGRPIAHILNDERDLAILACVNALVAVSISQHDVADG